MRQAQALAVMMRGDNVFLTGAPGAGKTYVLNHFVQTAQSVGKRVAVTASTGIAASHLGGTTIHSWSGLGVLDVLSDYDAERLAGSDRLIKRYNGTDILVIDEVSMLHGFRLDMINRLSKLLRAGDKPFGGMQVILVGDLFQLPPVSRGAITEDFMHLSETWAELNPSICYITEQHRQQAHDGLLEILEAMRSGATQEHHGDLLRERLQVKPPDDTALTRLYAHNLDVDTLNQRHLSALTTETRAYVIQTKGSKAKIEQLMRGLLVPETLTLKIGAEVMFVANNFAEGFVNGSRGTVIDFRYGLPLVRLLSGKEISVDFNTWSLSEDGKVRAEISQLPLRLAWAITIHKSQGMSLDAAEVDLSRAFTPGMGYVALSRVRSLAGLYLKGVNRVALTMHPHMSQFDTELRSASRALATETKDYVPTEQAATGIHITTADSTLFETLKQWRTERARADGVPPFMVANNAALQAVAAAKPVTTQALLGVSGFGPRKVEQFGVDIIQLISRYKS